MRWSKVIKPDPSKGQEVESYSLQHVSDPKGRKGKSSKGSFGGALSAIEREAYETGFASGERAGQELGLKKTEATQHLLLDLIEEIKDLRESLLVAAEGDMIKIAMAAARRVVRQEIAQNREVTTRFIQEAIRKMGKTETITIRVHTHDLERLHADCSTLAKSFGEHTCLKFKADANLVPGECIVSSHDRIIDARIDSQFSIIEQEINKTITEGEK